MTYRQKQVPRSIKLALFFLVAATLLLEVALTRAFDVVLNSNLAYFVITSAILGIGTAGLYQSLWPTSMPRLIAYLPRFALCFAGSALLILPAMNVIPFDLDQLGIKPLFQIGCFLSIYVCLILPFFLAGMFLVAVFTIWTEQIQLLYFWDLLGAALGCVVAIVLLRPYGPGGILFVVAGVSIMTYAFLASLSLSRRVLTISAAIALAIYPLSRADYIDFIPHLDKRGVKSAHQEGHVLATVWDPVSKIEVIRLPDKPWRLHIAFDGGQQSSNFYRFDGDYSRLLAELHAGGDVTPHFWGKYTFVSHYLLRDRRSNVLVIGAAGGQETKAALMFGAKRVDAVELVAAVLELGKGQFADFTGHIYLDPRVHLYSGEARAFTRQSRRRYDIIQLHSIHTSSSAAQGIGALSPTYLQTREAYVEFFSALSDDGILHINHHVYPRILTTAAAAWEKLGKTDFLSHVVVIRNPTSPNLPTTLIRMRPWTRDEVKTIGDFFNRQFTGDANDYSIVLDPTNLKDSELPPALFASPLDDQLIDGMEYRIAPCTDNQPYFNFIRKKYSAVDTKSSKFMEIGVANHLNSSLRRFVPMDVAHLFATGIVALIFCAVFVALPLRFATIGGEKWPGKKHVLIYFACLGAGFMMLELTLIQVTMNLIGSPVTTIALVLFMMLASAGLGSLCSRFLNLQKGKRANFAFTGLLISCSLFLIVYPPIFSFAMGLSDHMRMVVASIMIFPVGFFVGMPFPLGMEKLAGHRGAVAWAWAINGVFTVIGSLASVVLGVTFGFRATILAALAVYLIAGFVFQYLAEWVNKRYLAPGTPTTNGNTYVDVVRRVPVFDSTQ